MFYNSILDDSIDCWMVLYLSFDSSASLLSNSHWFITLLVCSSKSLRIWESQANCLLALSSLISVSLIDTSISDILLA